MLGLATALVGAPAALGRRAAGAAVGVAGAAAGAAGAAVGTAIGVASSAAGTAIGAAGTAGQAVTRAVPELPATRGRRVRHAGDVLVAEVRGLHRGIPASRRAEIEALAAAHGLEVVHVNAVHGRVALRGDAVRHPSVDALLQGLDELTGDDSLPRDVGLPGDREPVVAAAVGASFTALAAVASRFSSSRITGPVPGVLAAGVALVDNQPRLRTLVEQALGPTRAELAIGLANASAQGVAGSTLSLASDAVQRGLGFVELLAREQAWRRWQPLIHERGTVDVLEPARPPQRETELGPGPVEQHADRAALAGLAAPVLALAGRHGLSTAADTVLLAVPKAARSGREAFASVLATALSRRGVIALDPQAWRRLDRLGAVVVDTDALRSGGPLVLDTRGPADGWSDARLWAAAQAALWQTDGAEGIRLEPPTAAVPQWLPARSGDEVVGEVLVGREVDPHAEELFATCRRAGLRVLLAGERPPADLRRRADAVLTPGASLSAELRRLQQDGTGVALLSRSGHRGLAAADVALGLVDCADQIHVPWSSDLLVDGLPAAIHVLAAVPAARRASSRGAALAASGSLLGLLLLVSGTRRRGLLRAVSPVAGAAAAGLGSGAVLGAVAARQRVSRGHAMVPWHALPPELVAHRLASDLTVPTVEDQARLLDGQLTATARAAEWLATPRDAPHWLSRGPLGPLHRQTTTLARHVAAELSDPLTPVLSVGGAASAVLGSPTDAALVGAVMGANALVSAVQRIRAERALRGLLLGQALTARLVRTPLADVVSRPVPDPDLPTTRIPAERLQVGDVIALGAGDVVPADARLLAADGLELDESALTGESHTVEKVTEPAPKAPLAERLCMVYAGTTVVAGSGVAVVVAAGANTEAGRAIQAVRQPSADTGVQAQLKVLTTKALPLTIAGGAAVTLLSRLRLQPLRTALADGIAIAVAAVPEGLPLVATVAQLAAARRLSRHGVLVRSNRTVEALGRVDTICFDKTGTLTEGRLRVVALADLDQEWTVDQGEASPDARRLLRAAARACPAPDEGPAVHATDQAVIEAAQDHLGQQGEHVWQPLDELPFQSNRGFAASLGRTRRSTRLVVKGAPEVLLPRCTSVLSSPDGRAVDLRPLDDDARDHAERVVHRLAAQGLRVLVVARRELVDEPTDLEQAVQRLVLVGFVGLADVAHPSARIAVDRLHGAGIDVRMITGDHPVTARAVAEQLGFRDIEVVTGDRLEDLDEDHLQEVVLRHRVFARVTPEQKVRVVEALQARGRVVAMTGDGSNDAAAIRRADVGVAILGRASSPASQAADLVVTSADLVVMLAALLEGRRMWQRTRDAVSVLVGGNAGEVAFTVVGTAVTGRAPVNTRQLLLVNLLTDMFPAMALALAPDRDPAGDGDVSPEERADLLAAALETAPRAQLDRELVRAIGFRGVVTAGSATAAWLVGRGTGRPRRASTMGLVALVSAQLLQTLHAGRRSPLVWITVVGSGAALATVVQVPGLSRFFGCTPLGPVGWATALGSAAGVTAVGSAGYVLVRRVGGVPLPLR